MPVRRIGILGLVAGVLVAGCGPNPPTPDTPLRFTPDGLPEARVGVAYEVTITVRDALTPVGDIFLSKGALPTGLELTFDPTQTGPTGTARIRGTPAEVGSWALTVSARCYGTMKPGQAGDKDYVLVVR